MNTKKTPLYRFWWTSKARKKFAGKYNDYFTFANDVYALYCASTNKSAFKYVKVNLVSTPAKCVNDIEISTRKLALYESDEKGEEFGIEDEEEGDDMEFELNVVPENHPDRYTINPYSLCMQYFSNSEIAAVQSFDDLDQLVVAKLKAPNISSWDRIQMQHLLSNGGEAAAAAIAAGGNEGSCASSLSSLSSELVKEIGFTSLQFFCEEDMKHNLTLLHIPVKKSIDFGWTVDDGPHPVSNIMEPLDMPYTRFMRRLQKKYETTNDTVLFVGISGPYALPCMLKSDRISRAQAATHALLNAKAVAANEIDAMEEDDEEDNNRNKGGDDSQKIIVPASYAMGNKRDSFSREVYGTSDSRDLDTAVVVCLNERVVESYFSLLHAAKMQGCNGDSDLLCLHDIPEKVAAIYSPDPDIATEEMVLTFTQCTVEGCSRVEFAFGRCYNHHAEQQQKPTQPHEVDRKKGGLFGRKSLVKLTDNKREYVTIAEREAAEARELHLKRKQQERSMQIPIEVIGILNTRPAGKEQTLVFRDDDD